MLPYLNPVQTVSRPVRWPHRCHAFGLTILSDIPLYGETGVFEQGDVIVRRGCLARSRADRYQGSGFYRASASVIDLQVEHTGVFRIRQGHEIVYDVSDSIDPERIVSFVAGQGMAMILHQRAKLTLHGSAVAGPYGGVAFLGPCGSGKSTLATGFTRTGWSFVTDDIIALEWSESNGNRRPVIATGFNRARLRPDAVKPAVGVRPDQLPGVYPKAGKRWFVPGTAPATATVPLRAAFFLEQGVSIEIQPMDVREAFSALLPNAYTASLVAATGTAAQHIRQCTRFVETVPLFRLTFPHTFDCFETLLAALERLIGDLRD